MTPRRALPIVLTLTALAVAYLTAQPADKKVERISVWVMSAAGQPIADATVRLLDADGQPEAEGRSGQDGGWVLAGARLSGVAPVRIEVLSAVGRATVPFPPELLVADIRARTLVLMVAEDGAMRAWWVAGASEMLHPDAYQMVAIPRSAFRVSPGGWNERQR